MTSVYENAYSMVLSGIVGAVVGSATTLVSHGLIGIIAFAGICAAITGITILAIILGNKFIKG